MLCFRMLPLDMQGVFDHPSSRLHQPSLQAGQRPNPSMVMLAGRPRRALPEFPFHELGTESKDELPEDRRHNASGGGSNWCTKLSCVRSLSSNAAPIRGGDGFPCAQGPLEKREAVCKSFHRNRKNPCRSRDVGTALPIS